MLAKTESYWNILIVVTGLALFVFSTYKAQNISFTYDESSTVLEYAKQDYLDIFQHASRANNHVLNTALIKFCGSIFPKSEIVFRLPALFAHLLYLLFSALLIFNISNTGGAFRCLAFVVLNFNPYLLDFFSLARGYGLALGFTMGSVYFLVRYLNQNRSMSLLGALAFSSLSVLSNFSWLNFHLALLAVLGINWLLNLCSKDELDKVIADSAIALLFSIVLVLLIYQPIQELLETNELYFGGESDVWNDTIYSLIFKSLYYETPTALIITLVQLFIGLACVFIMYSIVKDLLKLDARKHSRSRIYVGLLLPTVLIGSTLQHFLFGTRFLVERTATFLIPLFLLSLIFSLARFETKRSKRRATMFLGTLAIVFFAHTLVSSNMSQSLDWAYEKDTKKMMHRLGSKPANYQVQFGVSWPYTETCRFYQWLYNYDWLAISEIQGTAGYHDYKSKDALNFKGYDLNYVQVQDTAYLPPNPREFSFFNQSTAVLALYSAFKVHETQLGFTWSENQTLSVEGELFTELLVTEIAGLMNSDSLLNVRIDATVKGNKGSGLEGLTLVLSGENNLYHTASENWVSNDGIEHQFQLFCKTLTTNKKSGLKVYFMNTENEEFEITDFRIHALQQNSWVYE